MRFVGRIVCVLLWVLSKRLSIGHLFAQYTQRIRCSALAGPANDSRQSFEIYLGRVLGHLAALKACSTRYQFGERPSTDKKILRRSAAPIALHLSLALLILLLIAPFALAGIVLPIHNATVGVVQVRAEREWRGRGRRRQQRRGRRR